MNDDASPNESSTSEFKVVRQQLPDQLSIQYEQFSSVYSRIEQSLQQTSQEVIHESPRFHACYRDMCDFASLSVTCSIPMVGPDNIVHPVHVPSALVSHKRGLLLCMHTMETLIRKCDSLSTELSILYPRNRIGILTAHIMDMVRKNIIELEQNLFIICDCLEKCQLNIHDYETLKFLVLKYLQQPRVY